MTHPNSGFVSLQEAKDTVGELKPSDVVKKKLGDVPAVEPTIAVHDIRMDGELYFKVILSYYYAGEHLQLLVAETKDTNNATVEFTEKLWEYDENKERFLHEKYYNGVKTVQLEQMEGYGKPEDIPEFRAIQTAGFLEDMHTCTASGTCCHFGGTMDEPYNHCGKYCGDYNDAGGGYHVNICDACCENHDDCLQSAGDDRCHCDEILNHCYHLNSCPGDSIMGAGIRAAAFFASCDYEQFW